MVKITYDEFLNNSLSNITELFTQLDYKSKLGIECMIEQRNFIFANMYLQILRSKVFLDESTQLEIQSIIKCLSNLIDIENEVDLTTLPSSVIVNRPNNSIDFTKTADVYTYYAYKYLFINGNKTGILVTVDNPILNNPILIDGIMTIYDGYLEIKSSDENTYYIPLSPTLLLNDVALPNGTINNRITYFEKSIRVKVRDGSYKYAYLVTPLI